MAEQEHLDVLHRGVAAWKEWRVPPPKVRPDLSSTPPSWLELAAADLHHCSLNDSRLHYTQLSNADLYRAAFGNASLYGADLRGARIIEASFAGADMTKVDLR